MLHVAVYAGVPRANHALKIIKETYAEMGVEPMTTGEFYQRDRTLHPPALTPSYKTSVTRSPRCALLSLHNTLREITGPAFGHDTRPARQRPDPELRQGGESRSASASSCTAACSTRTAAACPDTLVEFWQANAGGRYRHKKDTYLAPIDPNFGGCGRALTDADGRYCFRTVKPGAYPWRELGQQLAARAHPLLGLRLGLRPAADHPDVLRGRPADPALPDRRGIPRRGGGRAADRAARHERVDPAGQPRLQVRHRAARARARRCSRTGWRATDGAAAELPARDRVADRRALRAYRLRAERRGIGGVYPETELGRDIAGPNAAGERIRVEGQRLRRDRRAGEATC